jgi:hypothetical protein
MQLRCVNSWISKASFWRVKTAKSVTMIIESRCNFDLAYPMLYDKKNPVQCGEMYFYTLYPDELGKFETNWLGVGQRGGVPSARRSRYLEPRVCL